MAVKPASKFMVNIPSSYPVFFKFMTDVNPFNQGFLNIFHSCPLFTKGSFYTTVKKVSVEKIYKSIIY